MMPLHLLERCFKHISFLLFLAPINRKFLGWWWTFFWVPNVTSKAVDGGQVRLGVGCLSSSVFLNDQLKGLGADLFSYALFPPIFTFHAKKTKVEISHCSGLHWLNEVLGVSQQSQASFPCLMLDSYNSNCCSLEHEDVNLQARAQRKVLECSTKLSIKSTINCQTQFKSPQTLMINILNSDIHLQ